MSFFKKNQNLIFIAVVVCVLLFVGYMMWSRFSGNGNSGGDPSAQKAVKQDPSPPPLAIKFFKQAMCPSPAAIYILLQHAISYQ